MLLKDKAARLEKDLKGHLKNIEDGIAYDEEKAAAKIAGAFEVARIPAPEFKEDASVEAMFKAALGVVKKAKAKAGKDADAKEL